MRLNKGWIRSLMIGGSESHRFEAVNIETHTWGVSYEIEQEGQPNETKLLPWPRVFLISGERSDAFVYYKPTPDPRYTKAAQAPGEIPPNGGQEA